MCGELKVYYIIVHYYIYKNLFTEDFKLGQITKLSSTKKLQAHDDT